MKAVKNTILLCWIMLIVCFIIKLFGGNWFEIICNNKHFVYVCDFIDRHLILNYAIAYPIYVIPTFFIMLACSNVPKPNWKQALVIFVFVSASWGFQFIHPLAKMALETVSFLILPFICELLEKNKKTAKEAIKDSWYRGIIGFVLDWAFQIISFVTKNIGIKVVDENSLLSLMLMLDYFIMIALYYLYVLLKNKKKEGPKNGTLGDISVQ